MEKQKFWGSWVVGVLASVRPRARLSLGLPVPHYHLVQENLRPTPALSIPRHTSFWPPGGMLSSLSVQFPSVAQSCQTLQPDGLRHARLPCLSPTLGVYSNSCPLSQPSNHLILCPALLLLPPIPPSIRVFLKDSVLCIRWPKHWSFSFNISPSNEYLVLVSLRMDWFDLLAVQKTLKSLLQHHSSKASILQHSAFFIDQLSHPYMTTRKTIALTRRTTVVQ